MRSKSAVVKDIEDAHSLGVFSGACRSVVHFIIVDIEIVSTISGQHQPPARPVSKSDCPCDLVLVVLQRPILVLSNCVFLSPID